jgi:hypothetical protein
MPKTPFNQFARQKLRLIRRLLRASLFSLCLLIGQTPLLVPNEAEYRFRCPAKLSDCATGLLGNVSYLVSCIGLPEQCGSGFVSAFVPLPRG